jgi:hypothetical protein
VRATLLISVLTLAGASAAVDAQVLPGVGGFVTTKAPSGYQFTSVAAAIAYNTSTNVPGTSRSLDDIYSLNVADPALINLVNDPANPLSGRQVFQITALSNYSLDDHHVARSEVSPRYDYAMNGSAHWYAASVYFPDDWYYNNADTIVTQLQTSQNVTVVSPPVSIVARRNDLLLALHANHRQSPYAGDTRTITDPVTKANSANQEVFLGKIQKNHWYCFVMQANWSDTPGAGLFKLWVNGTLAYESANAYNDYDSWLGNFAKAGIYIPGTMTQPIAQQTMYTDFIYLGGPDSSYQEMMAKTICGG